MNSKIQTDVTLMFIRGGISGTTKNPYLCVSNGRAEFFVNLKKGSNLINKDTFNDYEEEEDITLTVLLNVGTDHVTLIGIKPKK